ncbi:MAG: type II toxin-antitoxin system RelE/ParE family toxin [gamma proteobacterium symbiont of Taylorina sp.]|nr:type II toxin-antitoxin system RelE/ParE family toxin [gamma proteobacterium symbiont of Taylorina sp.]
MPIYKVSPATEQDLVNIYFRGLKNGGEQADKYQCHLVSAFHTMVNNPDLGRKVAIRPQLQQYDVIPYVIFLSKVQLWNTYCSRFI